MANSNPYDILNSDDEAPPSRRNKPKNASPAPAQPAKLEEKAVDPTDDLRPSNRGRVDRSGGRHHRDERGGRRGGRSNRGASQGRHDNTTGERRTPKHEGMDRQSGRRGGRGPRKGGAPPHDYRDRAEEESAIAPEPEAPVPEGPAAESTEQPTEQKEQPQQEQQPEAVPEPEEPPVFTYEEYLAQKDEQSKSNEWLGARQEKVVDTSEFTGFVVQSKPEDDDDFVGKSGKKKSSQRSIKTVKVDVDIHHTPVDRPGRGGRGRGEGRSEGRRGGRGGGRGRGEYRGGRGEYRGGQGSRGGAVDISSASDFPSL